ncbi:MAG: matrixin family metalloprotease [Myxococcota bacterium]
MTRNHFVGLAAVLLLFASNLSYAYILLSPRRAWQSPPTYIVDNGGLSSVTDSDGGISATINAITSNAAWNGSGSGTVINATSGSTAGLSLGDGTPMLDFDDPFNACTGTCLAATFTGFFSGGDITDADIVTNTSYSWTSAGEAGGCSGEFYIEGVMVHEIGHALGLAHTPVSGATMFASVASCDNTPASTEADDDLAIQDLYGSGSGGPANPNSCASSSTCGNQAPGGCWCDSFCQFYGDCCPDGPC